MSSNPFNYAVIQQTVEVFEELVNQCESLKQQLIDPTLLPLAKATLKQFNKTSEELFSSNSGLETASKNPFNCAVIQQTAKIFEELINQCKLLKQQLPDPTLLPLAETTLKQFNKVIEDLSSTNNAIPAMKEIKLKRPNNLTFLPNNEDFSNN